MGWALQRASFEQRAQVTNRFAQYRVEIVVRPPPRLGFLALNTEALHSVGRSSG